VTARQKSWMDNILGTLLAGAVAGAVAWGATSAKLAAVETAVQGAVQDVRTLQVNEGKRDERDLWIARTLEKISRDVETLTKDAKK